MEPAASIVIPAHNEETVIRRTLETMLADARPGEFHVVVVCNGCTDRTAEVAASVVPPVDVVTIPEPSKITALNAGDAHAGVFPRVYLDADVLLSTAGVRSLCAAFADETVLAAAPALSVDVSASSPAVRSYMRVWRHLPAIDEGLAGRGVYAVSAAGRARFGAFPDVIADDRFVHELFAADERVTVPGAVSVVRAPADLRSLLRRRIRVVRGNAEQPSGSDGAPRGPQWLAAVRRHPRLLPHLPVFVAVSVGARAAALAVGGRGGQWGRDASSR